MTHEKNELRNVFHTRELLHEHVIGVGGKIGPQPRCVFVIGDKAHEHGILHDDHI